MTLNTEVAFDAMLNREDDHRHAYDPYGNPFNAIHAWQVARVSIDVNGVEHVTGTTYESAATWAGHNGRPDMRSWCVTCGRQRPSDPDPRPLRARKAGPCSCQGARQVVTLERVDHASSEYVRPVRGKVSQQGRSSSIAPHVSPATMTRVTNRVRISARRTPAMAAVRRGRMSVLSSVPTARRPILDTVHTVTFPHVARVLAGDKLARQRRERREASRVVLGMATGMVTTQVLTSRGKVPVAVDRVAVAAKSAATRKANRAGALRAALAAL